MSTIPIQQSIPENVTRPQARLESIDGLRGLACLMVLLGHSSLAFGNIDYLSAHLGFMHFSQARFFASGSAGVDLFFVLSGFCLAYPIVARPERAVNWKQYAVNRVRRIMPPFWAAMLLFGCLSLWISHHAVQPFLAQQILVWPTMRQLIYSLLLISASFNASFWTLEVEGRWYFVLPALIWLWRRIGGVGVVLCMIAVSLVSIFVYWPSHYERLRFFVGWLPIYMALFGLGIWAASLVAGKQKYLWEGKVVRWAPRGVGLALSILVLFSLIHVAFSTPVDMVLRLVTRGPLCFFLVLAATQDSRVRRFASWHPLIWVGTFSYSLYLVHEPFLQMAAALILTYHWSVGRILFLQIVVLPTLLIGFGYLFFLVAERPFLRRPVKKAIEAEQHGFKLEEIPTGVAS